MSRPRVDLHMILETILGSKQVYFQRPASQKLVYPAIIYSLSDKVPEYADNKKYISMNRYQVKVISQDSTNTFADDILEELPFSSFDRRYVADNLYHDVLDVYF